jgi:hypothetical protein
MQYAETEYGSISRFSKKCTAEHWQVSLYEGRSLSVSSNRIRRALSGCATKQTLPHFSQEIPMATDMLLIISRAIGKVCGLSLQEENPTDVIDCSCV